MLIFKGKFYLILILLIPLVILSHLPDVAAENPSAEKAPTRIISLSPNITEILFTLGLEGQIVGVTDFCKYPPEAQNKPSIGNLLAPNVEEIISFKPDLIIMLPTYEKMHEKLQALNIKTLEVKNETINDVLNSIKSIGETTHRQSEAKQIVKEMKSKLARIKRTLKDSVRVRVLFVADRNPGSLQQIYTAGPGTFIDEMISAAGGENIIKNSIGKYPIISKEEIIVLDPEVILDASFTQPGKRAPDKKSIQLTVWKQLPSVSAVKNSRVIPIYDPSLTIPGIRIPENIKRLKDSLHPELVEEFENMESKK